MSFASKKVRDGKTGLIGESAISLARRIAAGEVSSVDVVQAYLDRMAAVASRVNAVSVSIDSAMEQASAADMQVGGPEPLGPLHGVPVSVKESFHLAGTASTMGLATRDQPLAEDGIMVRRLKNAGAIIVAKTNVPQMMLWHECDNPLYGRTNNPWDTERTPGGSTGGEAALIAAGGSPLGLGGDLGGSIRVPCHYCGIHGLKPTSHRLSRSGSIENLRGMETMVYQPGPMARYVADLRLAYEVLVSGEPYEVSSDVVPPIALPPPQPVSKWRVAYWTDDGYFTPAPAIQRVVREAASELQAGGAAVAEIEPRQMIEMVRIYYGIMGADGGRDARRLCRGNQLDPRLRKLLRVGRIPSFARPMISFLLRAFGQRYLSDLLLAARPRSASKYWDGTHQLMQVVRHWDRVFQDYDVLLTPPHGLPAMRHQQSIDLLPAASHAFLPNVLGSPAGVVSLSRVRAEEESSRETSGDKVVRQASLAEKDSAGLPVGVQVICRPWDEGTVLDVMQFLEDRFRDKDDYPARQVV